MTMQDDNAERGGSEKEEPVNENEKTEGQETEEKVEAKTEDGKEGEKTEAKQGEGEKTDGEKTEKKETTPAWLKRRIDVVTAKRREAEAERDAIAKERDALRKLLEDSLGNGAEREDGKQPPQNAEAVERLTEADIERRAAALADIREYNNKCNAIYAKGVDTFDDFQESIETLTQLGGLTREMVEAALETDVPPEKIFHALGQDPETAEKILALPPARQAAAIVKYGLSLDRKRTVSKVPRPIKPIDGSSEGDPDPEKMSPEQWMEWRKKDLEKKGIRNL